MVNMRVAHEKRGWLRWCRQAVAQLVPGTRERGRVVDPGHRRRGAHAQPRGQFIGRAEPDRGAEQVGFPRDVQAQVEEHPVTAVTDQDLA